MPDQQLAPIILFVYNRPVHTQKTLEALAKNELAGQSDLFIFADGPKNGVMTDSIKAVREVISQVPGFKSATVIERPQNMGLAKNIIAGVGQIVDQYGRVIVLEDDLYTSPYFLKYMNDALNYYENNDKVVCIHGWMWPEEKEYPPFFLRGTDCWGWATWKKGWDLFEENGQVLLDKLEQLNLCREFDLAGAYDYTQMLRDQIKGKNNSWAVRWHAAAFIQQKLCLHPGVSLINNIGTDSSGTHCESTDSYSTKVSDHPINVGVEPVEENREMVQLKTAFHNSLKPSIVDIILNKIKQLFNK